MGNIKEAFCKNFTRLVESSDLTQKAMAQKLEVTEPTFYRWKSGENTAPLEKVEQLAKLLNVDPIEFYRTEPTEQRIISITDFRSFLGSIPDDIYNMSQVLGPDHKVWDIVRGAYDHAAKSNHNHNGKTKNKPA